MKTPMNVLALAYELRSEGISWKAIEIGLGVKSNTIMKAINRHNRR